MRLLAIFIGLAVLFMIPFLLWEETFQVSQDGAIRWLEAYGRWAWAGGLVLLMGDLLLPVPATVIMSALGYFYGTWLGGVLSAAGSVGAGLLGYGLCRLLGERTAKRLLGAKDWERGQRISSRVGGWFVVLSRCLPLFPEVVACMAGLTRMPIQIFVPALICGALPIGIIFAAIGDAGHEAPGLALALSAGVPALFWLVVQRVMRPKIDEADETKSPSHDRG